tara:strand:- start:1171 stop:1671 length:501 start_codon:yes stop_codon:yes gene_type:complete
MWIYPFIGISLIYLSEIGGYFWHRIFAHQDIIPMVRESHRIHHTDIDDKAHEDFIYVCFFLFVYFWALLYLWYKTYINLALFLVLYFGVFLPFVWSWYIHSAYHIEAHWLNGYSWFRRDKRIHMQHHADPKTNYGIATHFTDEIMGTLDYAFPISSLDDCIENIYR